jgi:hypothetical protein
MSVVTKVAAGMVGGGGGGCGEFGSGRGGSWAGFVA